ncbi:MAG: hypothetical protein ACFNYD_02775 [Bacteroides sp.]
MQRAVTFKRILQRSRQRDDSAANGMRTRAFSAHTKVSIAMCPMATPREKAVPFALSLLLPYSVSVAYG